MFNGSHLWQLAINLQDNSVTSSVHPKLQLSLLTLSCHPSYSMSNVAQ